MHHDTFIAGSPRPCQICGPSVNLVNQVQIQLSLHQLPRFHILNPITSLVIKNLLAVNLQESGDIVWDLNCVKLWSDVSYID
jgi:hypothetical protein